MAGNTRIFKQYNFDGEEKDYIAISYSQLGVFLQCPLRWLKYYLKGEGEPSDTESTQLGVQVHAAIEEFCYKKSQGYEWCVGEFVDLVSNNLDKREIKFKPDEDEVIVDQHLDMAKSIVDGMQGLGKLLKHCDVVGQEVEFKYRFKLPFDITFGNKIYKEVVINGFIDLILKDKETSEFIIIDHKTSKKVFDEDKLWKDYQFPIYQLVVLERYGKLPSKCYYYFTRFDELKEAPTLVMNDEDSEVVKYYRSGKNAGKPKYVIKSVGMVKQELGDIFKQMYAPSSVKDYKANATALCSWCTFGAYELNTCNKQKRPIYIRKDVPLPTRNKRTVKAV